jgi:hypothetical protein
VAGTLLGPLIERWRRKKEAERRKLEGGPVEEPPPPPPPPHDGPDRPRLPYEDVLEDVFGGYINRRRREAEEERRAEAEAESTTAVEEEPFEEETPPPTPEPAHKSLASMEETSAAKAVEPARARRRSLDEALFLNPRLSPGAKLLVASEILGRPRGLRR